MEKTEPSGSGKAGQHVRLALKPVPHTTTELRRVIPPLWQQQHSSAAFSPASAQVYDHGVFPVAVHDAYVRSIQTSRSYIGRFHQLHRPHPRALDALQTLFPAPEFWFPTSISSALESAIAIVPTDFH
jgi:hypothetical protein